MRLERCYSCMRTLTAGAYYRDASKPRGMSDRCKKCHDSRAPLMPLHGPRSNGVKRRSVAHIVDWEYRTAYPFGPVGYVTEGMSYAECRRVALAAYGNACAWCDGCDGLEFDHVNSDGDEHRESETHGSMYRKIARSGLPLVEYQLQLLCRRCHHAKSKAINFIRSVEADGINSLRVAASLKQAITLSIVTERKAALTK